MARKRVTYTFDEDLIKRIDKYSEKTMIPKSRVVEQAIVEYLDRTDQEKANKA